MFKRFAILATLTLSACKPVTEGEVIDKRHEAARTWVHLQPVMVGKSTILIPYTMHDDEDWVLRVQGEDRWADIYVDESVYDSYDIGDWWTKGAYDAPNDRHTKVRK